MPDLIEIAKDLEFRNLPRKEQIKAFVEKDPEFGSLSESEQMKGLDDLLKKTATTTQLIGRGIRNVPRSGWETVTGLAGMAMHPIETSGAFGQYAGKVGRAGLQQLFGEDVDPEATEAVKAYAEPIKKTIENPLGTPRRMLEYASEHPVETGLMVSGGLGGLSSLLKTALPKVSKVAATASKWSNPLYPPIVGTEKIISKVVPTTPPLETVVSKGMEKGIKPSVSGKATYSQAEKYKTKSTDAVRSIIENKSNLMLTDDVGNAVQGELPKNVKQFSQAIEQTKQSIFDKYDELIKQSGAKGAEVDLSPLAKELDVISYNAPATDLNRSVVKYAQDMSDTLRSRRIYTVKEAQDAIAILNNRLESFYKNPGYESASQAYVDAMMANNLRKALDRVVEGFTGEMYQPLKNQYGALRGIEKDVTHRSIVDARKNAKGILDFSDVFTGYHVVRGLLTLNPSTIAAGGLAKGLAWLYKRWNDPNKIVQKMFSKAEQSISKEPEFTPYAGAMGKEIPRFPESKYMVGETIIPESTPNLPVPFMQKKTGFPVPTGKGFGVESVRQPRLEWWRGVGAKGVKEIPTPKYTALPPGLGFTMTPIKGSEYPTMPIGKRHAQYLATQRQGMPQLTATEFEKEISLAKDALFRGVPLNKVKEFFKTRTGEEFPE